jgi:hypothetical protein
VGGAAEAAGDAEGRSGHREHDDGDASGPGQPDQAPPGD